MIIERVQGQWQNEQTRRYWFLAIVVGAVLLMALYSLSDPARLAHDQALMGSDWLGAGVCHRITARSFTIAGRQLPLCARCTGLYLGVALTMIVLAISGRLRHGDLPPKSILFLLIGFIGIMGVDGINSYTHFFPNFPHVYEPRNWLRLLTGIGTGLAMGLFIFPVLAQTLWKLNYLRPVITSFRELVAIVAVALTAVILLLSNQPTINYVLAIVSVVGLIAILASINAVLLLVLFRRDGLATRWTETAVPLGISIILAIGELIAMSLLRVQLIGTITGFPGL